MLSINWMRLPGKGPANLEDTMTGGQRDELNWRRSPRCQGGACVEVAFAGPVVKVRSSADPGKVLTLDAAGWRVFVTHLRSHDSPPQA